jgi:hypothetical protein
MSGKFVMTHDEFIAKLEAIEPDENGCRIWPGRLNINGRGPVKINGIRAMAHRWVLEHKLGRPIGALLLACHSCNVRACVNADHIYEGTDQDNSDDRVISGRQAYGELHCTSKLTWSEVDQIRELRGRLSRNKIAAKFGVSPTAIGRVWKQKNWHPSKRPKDK